MRTVTRPFEAALGIVERLRACGYEAYLAGGCVRDLLLGREPHDFDVATSATPDVVLGMFERTFSVGAHFGVVLVATCGAGAAGTELGEAEYFTTEVATFRSDGAYSDGRHPDAVRYTMSAEEDVKRRDFTINGLLLDVSKLLPRGLKPGAGGEINVRAEARTVQGDQSDSGAKAPDSFEAETARLKSCPDASCLSGEIEADAYTSCLSGESESGVREVGSLQDEELTSGAKAPDSFEAETARLKSCPDASCLSGEGVSADDASCVPAKSGAADNASCASSKSGPIAFDFADCQDGKLPSGAKAHVDLAGICGTAEAVPFQNNRAQIVSETAYFPNLNAIRAAVIDFVGGVGDLEAGVVRAIGRAETRFEEDRLRMLRGVRFAARFGFELEAGTLAAMRGLAGRIESVSRERVRDELTKMLTEGQARRAFELLDETGLLAEVLPEIARMKGVEQPEQFHPEGDVWVHTLGLLEQLEAGCPMTLGWGALLHDVGKPPTFRRAPDRIRFDGHVEVGVAMAAEICRRFRFSNEETRQIVALVENHMRFMDATRMKSSTLKRFFRLEGFEEHLALHRMDCMAGSGYLENWEFMREKWRAMPEEVVRPKPLITGRELIAAGYKPGARFKEMLRAVEDAQLEGTIGTAEEGMRLVRERFPKSSF